MKKSLLAQLMLLIGTVAYGQPQSTAATREQAGRPVKHAFEPNVRPKLVVPRIDGGIKLDGIVDDALWQQAATAANFSETFPGDQTKPPIGIEARMAYDEHNLYVAFLIKDDPAAIRSSLCDRDNIWQDDYVGLLLDPYAENAWSYFIAANPIGIQGDTRIVNGGDEDIGFDVVFQSEGHLNDDGYSVEMIIPFRSLRFPAKDVQTWSVNFWITHPRDSRRTYSWAAIDRDDPCWQCQFGRAKGIEGIYQRKGVELLPSLVAAQAGALVDEDDPSSRFDNERVKLEPSLGLKYAFNSNLIGDATVNPDFSQVEADAAQVDINTTFALFFPERRPFFQEGAELYNTYVQTVYTRTINNPTVAAKLTGRFNKTNLAYLGASDADTPVILPFEEQSEIVDAGRSYSNIGRYKRTFGDGSFLGGLITDRRYDSGGSGTTAGVDGSLRFLKNYHLEWQFVASHTDEPNDTTITEEAEDIQNLTFDGGKHTAAFDGESFSGYATYVSLERDSRFWNFDLDYRATSPAFRADAGFVFQNSTQELVAFNSFDFRPHWNLVDMISPWVQSGYLWNFDRVRKDEFLWVGFDGSFKMQTNAGLKMLLVSNERFKGGDFRGIQRLDVWIDSRFSEPLKLGSEVVVGESIARGEDVPVLGNGLDVSVWGEIKPTDRFKAEPQLSFARLVNQDTRETIFNGYILRTRFNYQFTRRLLFRLVTQYNEFDDRLEIDPLVTYQINPFTAFYLGSTHDYTDFAHDGRGFAKTDRQFFFKVQYLVRT
jgi:hypothetical protein